MVENIQEVVWEIESQPRENLLPEEVEEKFSHLMVRRREKLKYNVMFSL